MSVGVPVPPLENEGGRKSEDLQVVPWLEELTTRTVHITVSLTRTTTEPDVIPIQDRAEFADGYPSTVILKAGTVFPLASEADTDMTLVADAEAASMKPNVEPPLLVENELRTDPDDTTGAPRSESRQVVGPLSSSISSVH